MLHIEQLRIQLPPGYEHRASFIANLVGEMLLDYSPSADRSVESLVVAPVDIEPDYSDRQIASGIVQGILTGLGDDHD